MPLVQTLARATRQPRRVKPNAAAGVDASAIANALTLIGNDSANRLLGTAHADTLISNKGNDSLTGGGGADSFAFNQSPGASNRDTLTDFTVGADKLTFSRAVDKTLGTGNTTAQLLLDSGGSPIQTASSRLLFNTSTAILFYSADGSGSRSTPGEVAVLTGVTGLGVNDVVLTA